MNIKASCFLPSSASGLLFSTLVSAQAGESGFSIPSPFGHAQAAGRPHGHRNYLLSVECKGPPHLADWFLTVKSGAPAQMGGQPISFSTAVKLNGTDIPAGKYSLFTSPGHGMDGAAQ